MTNLKKSSFIMVNKSGYLNNIDKPPCLRCGDCGRTEDFGAICHKDDLQDEVEINQEIEDMLPEGVLATNEDDDIGIYPVEVTEEQQRVEKLKLERKIANKNGSEETEEIEGMYPTNLE